MERERLAMEEEEEEDGRGKLPDYVLQTLLLLLSPHLFDLRAAAAAAAARRLGQGMFEELVVVEGRVLSCSRRPYTAIFLFSSLSPLFLTGRRAREERGPFYYYVYSS